MDSYKALQWWDSLTMAGKNQFPTPKNLDDIICYYLNPGDYIQLEYGMV